MQPGAQPDWSALVAGVGFPITVALFLLWKILPKLEDIAISMTRLSGVVERLIDRIDTLDGVARQRRYDDPQGPSDAR